MKTIISPAPTKGQELTNGLRKFNIRTARVYSLPLAHALKFIHELNSALEGFHE